MKTVIKVFKCLWRLIRILFCRHKKAEYIWSTWQGTHSRGGYRHDVSTCSCGAVILLEQEWVGPDSWKRRRDPDKRIVIWGKKKGEAWKKNAAAFKQFDEKTHEKK